MDQKTTKGDGDDGDADDVAMMMMPGLFRYFILLIIIIVFTFAPLRCFYLLEYRLVNKHRLINLS